MTLREMIARQRELTEQARREGRSNLTAEEQTEFDNLQRQIDAARAAAERGAEGGESNPPAEGGRNEGVEGDGDPDPDAQRSAGVQEERSRVRAITDACRGFDIDPQPYIDGGHSVDQVRASILDQMRGNGAPVGVRVGESGNDRRRAAMVDALLMRAGIHLENPAAGAEDFRGASLRDIAASCLTAENSNSSTNFHLMDSSRLFDYVTSRQYFSPEALFPSILDQTVQKAYVEGHRTAPVTFDRFCTIGTLSDFKKSANRYVAGGFGDFLEVPEGGELKHFVPSDEKLPTRQLKTYGRQFTLSRQAFIDDDIGLITRLPRQVAQAARKTQNKQVYQILVGNGNIYDGKPLFHKDHKNLLAIGTGITQAAVQSMILALGGHRTKDGDAIMIRPAILVVPLGYKFQMYTLFNSATISASGDVNPLYQYRDQIEVVEDATINAMVGTKDAIPWFMFGAKEDVGAIQVDYLNGQQVPSIRRMEVSGQLGYVWDAFLDWGISVQDYRGIVKNPGVQIESPLALA